MVFNQSEPKWQDVRVRQALHLAIDRDEINELLYEGNGTTYPIIPYTHIFDRPPDASAGELGPWWRADPAEAQKLLSAAGAEGLKIEYLIYRGYVGDQNDVWVDQLRRVGVTLDLREADYVEYNSQLAAVSYPDAIGAWDQHGTQADNYFRNQILSTSPGNWHHINDPELDEWAEQQSVELDPEARREIHRKIWDKVLTDVHRVEHTNPAGYALLHGWIHGMTWMIGNDGFSGTTFEYDNGKFFSDLWIDKA
jgi:peptide/nickel transport system substrate-binding protein